MSDSINMTSNKPYIIGAFYDWISDNELTPYIAVDVSVYGVMVPMKFVNDGQIVLNISSASVGSIALGEFAIEFTARFGGKVEHLYVPYGAISAIYAKENGAGTSLPIEHPDEAMMKAQDEALGQESSYIDDMPKKPSISAVTSSKSDVNSDKTDSSDKPKKKPSLTVVK